jgi:hypothetical protein
MLRDLLQIAFDWSNFNLHRFVIHGREYGASQLGCTPLTLPLNALPGHSQGRPGPLSSPNIAAVVGGEDHRLEWTPRRPSCHQQNAKHCAPESAPFYFKQDISKTQPKISYVD